MCVLHLYTSMQLLFLHIFMSIYFLWIYFLSLHLLFNTIYWLSLCYTVIQHTTSLSWDYVIVQCTHYKKLTLAIHTFLQVQVLDFQPHLSLKPCMTGPWTLTLPIWAPCFHSSIYSKSAITAGWSLLGLKAQGLNPGDQAWKVGVCTLPQHHDYAHMVSSLYILNTSQPLQALTFSVIQHSSSFPLCLVAQLVSQSASPGENHNSRFGSGGFKSQDLSLEAQVVC